MGGGGNRKDEDKSKIDTFDDCTTVGGSGRSLKACWIELQDRNNDNSCRSCSGNDTLTGKFVIRNARDRKCV